MLVYRVSKAEDRQSLAFNGCYELLTYVKKICLLEGCGDNEETGEGMVALEIRCFDVCSKFTEEADLV